MTDPLDIRDLSHQRLIEARILFRNDKPDGAFYLAGYAVELMRKYRICERLGAGRCKASKLDTLQIVGPICPKAAMPDGRP